MLGNTSQCITWYLWLMKAAKGKVRSADVFGIALEYYFQRNSALGPQKVWSHCFGT